MSKVRNKPWAGRFNERTSALVEKFTASVSFDARLLPYDVKVGMAYANMLARQEIISKPDAENLVAGLEVLAKEFEDGTLELSEELEDVHMNVEALLTSRLGEVGERLHTGRSRNDLVATDLRLYVRDEIVALRGLVRDMQLALVRLAKANSRVIMPGYTHLQRAQPVLFAHHLMAYYEMLRRDDGRFSDCDWRIDEMPLGSAALAGPAYPVDRQFLADELGFGHLSRNSIDAVSDRDFVLECVSGCSILMMHLSRLCEELVLWSSQEFSFIELPDAFCTGSSIMPQKKNPDVPELIRGKSGRVFGALIALLTMMKGLPLAYNRDLQEDKEVLFDALDTTKACLRVLVALVPDIHVRSERMLEALEEGFLTATDLADYLVSKGVPFRQAHHQVGAAVGWCIEEGKRLSDLSLPEMKKFCPEAAADAFERLTPENSIKSRAVFGSTNRRQVLAAIRRAERELARS
ncbi:MAG: argininosuccinate lyase [Pseudomonadota bacterium]